MQTTSDIRRAAIEAGIPWDSLADRERANYCNLARCLVNRWREERAEADAASNPTSLLGETDAPGIDPRVASLLDEHGTKNAALPRELHCCCGVEIGDSPCPRHNSFREYVEEPWGVVDFAERKGQAAPYERHPAPSGEVDYEATPDCTCSMDGGAHAPGCGYGGWAGRVNNVDAGGGGVDYEAACKDAGCPWFVHRDLPGLVRKFAQACFAQGARSRLTPEELRAIGDAVDILEHISRGGEIGPGDDVLLAKATPVLRAIAGRESAK